MKRNSFFNLFVSAVLASFISFNRLNSQEIAGIANSLGSGEDLFFMEIPTVISSSKREQLITEAASSVEIVTAEDIKTSGATNLADALRSVSGLDIRQTNAGQHVIGIRGFADTAHVLVTLDGNNVFMYHANHIFLDWIPLAIEEIDRIEIIKGPGAIFYGGNAFSGVINIITKTPEELEGTQVNVLYGTQHTLRTNIINAAAFDNWQYTVTASMAEADKWDFPGAIQESDRYYNKSVSGKLIRKFDDNSKLTLGLRHSDSANVISGVCQPRTTFLYSRYDKEDFWARLFYGHHRKTFWGESFGVDDSNYEFETMKTFKFDKHILSIGLFAKHSEWEIKSFGLANPAIAYEDHSVNDLAINIEDEFHITNNFIISLGGRFEYNTYLHNLGLGRLSFIYKLPKEQNIRFTVANGYYMPSLFQQTNRGNAYPFAIGNRNLKEEKILSYELAYSNRTIKGLTINAALFYNNYKDLIDNTVMGPADNVADARQYGGEIDVQYNFNKHLSGFANYSYQTIDREDWDDLKINTEHKVNCGLRTKIDKWTGSITMHYVDGYNEMYITSNPVFGLVNNGDPVPVEGYMTFDARIAYSPTENLEFALSATNLFNKKHYESNPEGTDGAFGLSGEEIGQIIAANIHYKF